MTDASLPPIEDVPAAHLEGRILESGWSIGSRVTRDPGASGGHFSLSYAAVHEDGRRAFLKALNFSAVGTGPGSAVDRLNDFTSAYIFERDLLAFCRDRRMSRVIRIIDFGELIVPEAPPMLSKVPYLILELAEGDIRAYQSASARFDCSWVFRVLKHTLEGVEQLHSAHTAHQDLRPSNVLTQDRGTEMKLGDLGRADRRGVEGPWSDLTIPGAVVYAPPEQQYGYFGREWEERRAADLYLAGSLGAQLFLGHCMSVLIQEELPEEFRLQAWKGSFQDVLPALQNAHNRVIAMLERNLVERTGSKDIAEEYSIAIQQMTDPEPSRRGHPMDRASVITSSFAVRRYVSLMELLSNKVNLMGGRSDVNV